MVALINIDMHHIRLIRVECQRHHLSAADSFLYTYKIKTLCVVLRPRVSRGYYGARVNKSEKKNFLIF